MDAAQNQHYVPKFMLRQFLSDVAKERVHVFDKVNGSEFSTHIKNVMAERRFNEFIFEDYIVSFENIMCAIEDSVLPTYREVLEERKLRRTAEQQAALSFLVAFQMIRAKSIREMGRDIRDNLEKWLTKNGIALSRVKGWEPFDENKHKMHTLRYFRETVDKIAEAVSDKDFLLITPAAGMKFYLGDSPVALHNTREEGMHGSLGVKSLGIEIYMPLSPDLLLAVLCPSVVGQIVEIIDRGRDDLRNQLFTMHLSGAIGRERITDSLNRYDELSAKENTIVGALISGEPASSTAEQTDFYNHLQYEFASRHVICQRRDFALARECRRRKPGRGRRIRSA